MRRIMAMTIVGLAGCSLHVPMAADRPELDHFVASSLGPAVEVQPLRMAGKRQPECGVVGDASCLHLVEVIHAAYLVKHPGATLLIDTGLSRHAEDDVARFSFVPRHAFALSLEHGLGDLLAAQGNPTIDMVVLTHVHWDHTSGLTDLPGATVATNQADADYLKSFHGAEPAVMPDHFKSAKLQISSWDGPAYENFPASHDLFGDHSVVLVPLPGHTPGSIGIFLNDVHGKRILFVGDTVWGSDGYRMPSEKAAPMSHPVDQDAAILSDSIWRLHHLAARYPEMIIVPAHDGAAFSRVVELVSPSHLPK